MTQLAASLLDEIDLVRKLIENITLSRSVHDMFGVVNPVTECLDLMQMEGRTVARETFPCDDLRVVEQPQLTWKGSSVFSLYDGALPVMTT